MTTHHPTRQLLADLGRKYLWWMPIGDVPFSDQRIIAQTIRAGHRLWLGQSRP
jgi:hypothetical protein